MSDSDAVNQKIHTIMFLSYVLQNFADSGKMWYITLNKFAVE